MLVCKCCGKWTVEQHPRGLRVKHYGYLVVDAKSVSEVEQVLARHGLTLADLKEA